MTSMASEVFADDDEEDETGDEVSSVEKENLTSYSDSQFSSMAWTASKPNNSTKEPPKTTGLSSGTYAVSDARNTREDCKAQRKLQQTYAITITGERIRVEEWKMEGKLRGDRFVLESRQTRDFSPEYDCAMELKLRIEGKVTGTDQIDIKLSEVLSIEGSGHTECPDAAASLGYNEFSGLQCSIERSFRLKKSGS